MAAPRAVRDMLPAGSTALLCTLPWLNPFSSGPVPSVVPWLFAAIVACTAIAFSTSLAQREPHGRGRAWPKVILLLAVVAWAAVPRQATTTRYEMLALVGALLLIALGALLVRQRGAGAVAGRPWAHWCALWPWLAAGLVSSVFALLQYAGQATAFMPWINWAPPGEAFANLRQRNQFASLTNIALAALLAWRVLLPRQAPAPSGRAELLLAAALALLAMGNAASSSRTGLLQLLLLCAGVLVWRRERRVLVWLAFTLACYAIGVLVLPGLIGLDPSLHGLFSRLRAGDALCASRLTLWRNVLDLIAQRPWLGWGWGELDYAHYMHLYGGPRFCDILDNAHNLPLQLAVELGVPAALLACGAALWWALAHTPWRETDPMRQMAWLVLGVIALHSLLEYPLWYGPFQLACGLCLGILWRSGATPVAQPEHPEMAVPARVPVLLAASLFAACLYAAWDYRRISQIYLPPELRLPQYQADTMAQLQRSWLFRRQVLFAELSITAVTPDNAARVHALATELLHFSPEARVVEKLLDSARLLGRDAEVRDHAARFEAAFPEAYARWAARSGWR